MSHRQSTVSIPDTLAQTVKFRVLTCCILAVLMVLTLIVRLYQLQIQEHERYATQSIDNRQTTRAVAPVRGAIFDRNGNILATHHEVLSLAVVKENITDIETFIDNIRELLEISETEKQDFLIRFERSAPDEKVIVKRDLSVQHQATLAVNRYRYPLVSVVEEIIRAYPTKELSAHVVGSVRQVTKEDKQMLDPVRYRVTKFVGRRGVEKFYEDVLHGEVGSQTVEVNAHGRVLSEINQVSPIRGQTLTLHLDLNLQQVAYDALADRRGAVVAINPKNGGILAMVSRPSYDPNLFVLGLEDEKYEELTRRRDSPLFNRAIQGQYSPGSTFKPVVGLAGLALGKIDWETEIWDPNGEFKLPSNSRIYRDWTWTKNGHGGQGHIDLNRAIYRSSNIFFYHFAAEIEIDLLSDFARNWGYGQNTAIDVADADPGILPDSQWKIEHKNEPWYPGDNLNYVIGQGFMTATPLQLATVATLLANRGKWVRPRLLMASEYPIEFEAEEVTVQDITGLTDEDWDKMWASLNDVIHRGGQGYRQNGVAWAEIGMDINYQMAGKSGTAQVKEIPQGEEYDEETLSEYERKHALFLAFAPVEAPTIAVAVVVENGGGGSSVAGPVVRAVLDAHLADQVAIHDE